MQQLTIKTRAILYFYRTIIWLNLLASAAIVYWVLPYGIHKALFGWVWIKVPVFGLVFLLKYIFNDEDYYFYYNLRLTKIRLWVYSFCLDTLFYLLIVFLYTSFR